MSRPSSGKKSRHLQHEIEQIVRQEMTRLHGAACHIADNSTITLSLAVRPGESSLSVAMDPPLLDQIRNQLRDLDVQRGVYRRGAVYCYLDESSECPHCRPDSPSHVMAEYLPNGIPEWRDLRDVLIDEHPALAAQLFETRDLTAAVYMRGRDIKHRLLSSFGKSSRTYNILGQIVCGFLTIHPSEISDHAVTDLALTIQAVETRDVGGQMNLGLNIISGFHDLNILDHLTMPGYAGFREKLIDVNRSLETIARDIRAAAPHRRNALIHTEMSRIPGLMREIQTMLLKMNQRRHRRTGHAETRSTDNRPVSTAIEDLRMVHASDILEDPRNKTLIIPGRRRRWHVFSRNGRLVTSLFMERDSVQSRLARDRWRPADPARIETFLLKIRELYPGTAEPTRDTEPKKT